MPDLDAYLSICHLGEDYPDPDRGMPLAQQAQPLLRDAALPIVRTLAEEAAATAYLGVVDGPDLLSLVGAEPTSAEVHVAFRVGTRTPLERGAAGRAILAMRTTGGRPLEPPWVMSTGDAANGGYGIAACVTGIPGVECVVGVVTLTEPDEARLGPLVAQAAADITRTLA